MSIIPRDCQLLVSITLQYLIMFYTVHVPDLRMGLISISQLDTTGHATLFKHSKVYIFNRNGRILFTGTKDSSLYYLDTQYISQLQSHLTNVVTRSGEKSRTW
jgi:hypothetical protein